MLNIEALYHKVNSNYAYPLDESNLNITFRAKKNDLKECYLLLADPHDYSPDDNGIWRWAVEKDEKIKMEKKYSDELFDYFVTVGYCKYHRAKYIFLFESNNESYIYTSKGLFKVDVNKDIDFIYNPMHFFCFPYLNKEDILNPIPWAKNTIWYSIFPERFAKGKDTKGNYLEWGSVLEYNNDMFFGGNLQGVIEKIPYLKELGITGIYFNPIFEARTAHKYDTVDYFKIDPSFGTNDDLKQLVKVCHNNNIKVMLDGVFNHCGFYHPFFQDVINNGKASPYYDCFYIEKEPMINFEFDENNISWYKGLIPNYRAFAFTPVMPKLNLSNPIMEKYILDVGAYWIKEYDIDAWRLDVSNEVCHSFWRKFRTMCNSLKKDFYILGENWEDSSEWLRVDEFNAVMNYELTYPIWSFFSYRNTRRIDARQFSYDINKVLIEYKQGVSKNMFNLIDSHDTRRILYMTYNNKDLMKLAYIFLFSFCGSPVIYYGDEIGMTGGADPDNRRCMIWDESKQDKELFNFFKHLISIRQNNEDFLEVDIKWLHTDENVLIYQKKNTIIVMNNNFDNKTIKLVNELKNKTFKDLLLNDIVTLKSNVTLKPFECLILKES